LYKFKCENPTKTGVVYMNTKKFLFLYFSLLFIIIFTFPVIAIDNENFKNCSSCRENIEKLYENEEIDVVEWAFFKYYLSNNPFEMPDKARCDLHKGYIKSIDYLLNNKEKYVGEKVKIKGTFEGWDGKYGPPPVTRSDWIIADSTGGIYVYGPFPANLHPGDNEDQGEKLFLTGVLRKIQYDKENMYYIERTKPEIKTLIIMDDDN